MQTRISAILIASFLLAGFGADAQLPLDTLYVTSNFAGGGNGIRSFNAGGTMTSFVSLTSSGTGSLGMAAANDALLVWSGNGIHRYDLISGGAVFTSLPGLTSWGCLDEDGGMVWCSSQGNGSVYRADDPVGTNTTLIWTDPIAGGTANAICWNGSTGGYVVLQWSGSTSAARAVFLARDGSHVRTVSGITVLSGADWSPWTGDIIVSRFGGSATPGIVRIAQNGVATSIGSGSVVTSTANGVEVLDQNALNAEQFLVCDFGGAPTYLALIDGNGVINTLNAGTYSPSDCERLGARKLWSMNRWSVGSVGQLNLNMGRGSANDIYQVALALSHSPSFKIAGFTLHLTPDNLFFLTALNFAPTIFKNFTGTLDINGLPTVQPSVVIPRLAALSGLRVFGGAVSYGTGGVTGVSNCWAITIQ